MSKFNQGINEGNAKKVPIDKFKAKSLLKSADEAIYAARKLPLESRTLKSIIRELYEALRQYCEALGYCNGYKFLSHEVITSYLEEMINEPRLAAKFDRYRKIRNGINYYGDDVSEETAREALKEIPDLVEKLRKHIKI